MKYQDIIAKLSLEQKCALLSGGTVFTTRALPGKGIPAITLSDGPNGVRKQAGAADHLGLNPSVPATCFPTSATVANSWDPALGEAVGAAMGEEAAAQGVSVLLGPGLNIKRSPLGGRNFEYFSEDPYLAGKMAAAYVRGIQKNGIAACPKHFAVNSQELRRMASDSIVDERTLREIYLTGFEMVVKEAQPKTIMSAYNLVNGTYANENAHLLMDILRRDWGFDGAVVTDWGGSNDHALGVKNGSTLEMPAPGGDAIRELMKAVQTGKITEADVDARLEELLELVFTTKAAGDGTGLGLSVVQNILISHGGFIEAKSTLGQGSRFLVYLPITNQLPNVSIQEGKKSGRTGMGSILLVDDELRVVRYFKRRLLHLGYQVDAFTDPEEALNTFKRTPEHWDLLIVDEAMPKLRGTALLQYMKQHNHDLRVILVTGLVGDSAIRLHAERQIDEILTKPVEFEALSGTIVRLLSEETSDK